MSNTWLRRIALAIVSGAALMACSRGLTPDEQRQVDALRADLLSVQQEISAAERQGRQYSGDLKALTDARVEILKTSDALLRQRINAIESHSPVIVQTVATTPDEALASRLAVEIIQQEERVAAAEVEARKYSGGLLQAMALTTAATQTQTLALLRQRYLIAKLGLAVPTYTTSDEVPPTKTQNWKT